ncbi:MAG: aldo/keto reductase [Chthonomonadaceae bacterium]|nr:aldo/keto reductase [Chthonomonadaceae bacterium]
MEKRPLGNTGDSLSIVGVGGVVVVQMTQTEADAILHEAIDRGVNYFDVAPSYGSGQETEKRYGGALVGKRDKVFLACKTEGRTKADAEAELNRSLTNLQTDHFDLYQLHHITTVEEVETALGEGGAIEAILEAQAAGKIRHIGFSAHSVEAAVLAMNRFPFVSALFPVNFVTYSEGNFGAQIFEKCEEKGVARLALKAMAKTGWKTGADRSRTPHVWYEPLEDKRLAEIALRYTLSMPVTATVPPGDLRLFRWALEFAERYTPITPEEKAELLQEAKGLEPIFKAA